MKKGKNDGLRNLMGSTYTRHTPLSSAA